MLATSPGSRPAGPGRAPHRKVLETLPGLDREVEALEQAVERIGGLAEELARAADGLADDPQDAGGLLRDLAALRREAESAQSAAATLVESIAEARDTLAQLDEVGVADAAEDDRALEELDGRATTSLDLAVAILSLIDATADEAAEMRDGAGAAYDAD